MYQQKCLRLESRVSDPWGYSRVDMSYSLNSLKAGYMGDYIGEYFRGY